MYSRVICKLVINDILMPFLHRKALRTAMYKRYINSIIIIIIKLTFFARVSESLSMQFVNIILINRKVESENNVIFIFFNVNEQLFLKS